MDKEKFGYFISSLSDFKAKNNKNVDIIDDMVLLREFCSKKEQKVDEIKKRIDRKTDLIRDENRKFFENGFYKMEMIEEEVQKHHNKEIELDIKKRKIKRKMNHVDIKCRELEKKMECLYDQTMSTNESNISKEGIIQSILESITIERRKWKSMLLCFDGNMQCDNSVLEIETLINEVYANNMILQERENQLSIILNRLKSDIESQKIRLEKTSFNTREIYEEMHFYSHHNYIARSWTPTSREINLLSSIEQTRILIEETKYHAEKELYNLTESNSLINEMQKRISSLCKKIDIVQIPFVPDMKPKYNSHDDLFTELKEIRKKLSKEKEKNNVFCHNHDTPQANVQALNIPFCDQIKEKCIRLNHIIILKKREIKGIMNHIKNLKKKQIGLLNKENRAIPKEFDGCDWNAVCKLEESIKKKIKMNQFHKTLINEKKRILELIIDRSFQHENKYDKCFQYQKWHKEQIVNLIDQFKTLYQLIKKESKSNKTM